MGCQIERIQNGLEKILSANNIIEEMKLNLELMRPELEEASNETERMMMSIFEEKKEAD
jgi:hypothetical protein